LRNVYRHNVTAITFSHLSGKENRIMSRIRWHKKVQYAAIVLNLAMAHVGLCQGTVISISGPPDTTYQYDEPFDLGTSVTGVSWISTSYFRNVTVSIALEGDAGATGTAYLTQAIGIGATTSSLVAKSNFAFPSTTVWSPVLSGLNLGAGTYYLMILETAVGSNGLGVWNGTPYPQITSAATVSANGEYWSYGTVHGYAPATSFSEGFTTYLDYSVTSSVPEPSAGWLILVGGGISLAGWLRGSRFGLRM